MRPRLGPVVDVCCVEVREGLAVVVELREVGVATKGANVDVTKVIST